MNVNLMVDLPKNAQNVLLIMF